MFFSRLQPANDAPGPSAGSPAISPTNDRRFAMHKIVVFSGEFSHSVCKGIVELDRRVPDLQWLLVHHAPVKTAWRLVAKPMAQSAATRVAMAGVSGDTFDVGCPTPYETAAPR